MTQLNVGFLLCLLDDKKASTSSANSKPLPWRIPAQCELQLSQCSKTPRFAGHSLFCTFWLCFRMWTYIKFLWICLGGSTLMKWYCFHSSARITQSRWSYGKTWWRSYACKRQTFCREQACSIQCKQPLWSRNILLILDWHHSSKRTFNSRCHDTIYDYRIINYCLCSAHFNWKLYYQFQLLTCLKLKY